MKGLIVRYATIAKYKDFYPSIVFRVRHEY